MTQWLKRIFVASLDVEATVDVPTANINEVNLVKTRTLHFA